MLAQSFGRLAPEVLRLQGLMRDSHRSPRIAGHPRIHCNGGNCGDVSGRLGWRAQCGWVWVWDDGWERNAPIINPLCQPAGDGNVVLEVVGPLLGGPLFHMSRDAVEREDVDSHSEFASWIGHFILEFQSIHQ